MFPHRFSHSIRWRMAPIRAGLSLTYLSSSDSVIAQVNTDRKAEEIPQPKVFEINNFFSEDNRSIYDRKSLAKTV